MLRGLQLRASRNEIVQEYVIGARTSVYPLPTPQTLSALQKLEKKQPKRGVQLSIGSADHAAA